MSIFKPNLAGKYDAALQVFPCFASPKLDGIRVLALNGVPLSRTLKVIPNKHIQQCFNDHSLDGLDGELIVGDPTAKDCYRVTNSAVMSIDGRPDFDFYVFDRHDLPLSGFTTRFACIDRGLPDFCKVLPHRLVADQIELDMVEDTWVREGHEGVMLRNPHGLYKQGRSSTREGGLLKLKRFEDAEAEIISCQEFEHNANEATVDALGHTKRSTHQANKVPMNMLGAFVCRTPEGITFKVGSGFTERERHDFWMNRLIMIGRTVKYKFFPVGVKVAPRHPIYLGFREAGT